MTGGSEHATLPKAKHALGSCHALATRSESAWDEHERDSQQQERVQAREDA